MGKCRAHWLCFPCLKLTRSFRMGSASKRTLLIAILCLANLFFLVLKVGHLAQPRHRRRNEEQKRHAYREHHLDGDLPDTSDLQTSNLEVPTRINVLYITLKSKRPKPAHILGTVRPKLRKKVRTKTSSPSQRKQFSAERYAAQANSDSALEPPRKEGNPVDFPRTFYNYGKDHHISTIRIYSPKAPSWFSAQDVNNMRFLADAKVLRMKEIPRMDAPALLVFEGVDMDQLVNQKHLNRDVCGSRCGVIYRSVDSTEVFAFHLDRVLGLNRTIPAVSRKFGFLPDSQACQAVLWDASLYPEELAAGPATIHNRLDPNCCGFMPRQEDGCSEPGRHAACKDPENLRLANIVQRQHDLRHLVFTNNKGFFDRNEDNLNFRLLEGIKELPEQVVSVLRSGKLREKLLQSLFLDQMFWESQGGRQGIDKLIDVVEKRAKVLLTYINAHGIKILPMND